MFQGIFIIGKNEKIVIIVALVCGAWQQADAQYVSKVWVSDQKDGTYINPIIHADYSDPDVCAAGDDFYMTASSFGCTPGLPILHSKDLVNWRLANYALKEIEPIGFFNAPQHGKGYGLLLSVTTMVSFYLLGRSRLGYFHGKD